MQNLNMRRNCRRFSAQVGQLTNSTQKPQRLRCCGRVLSEQELLVNGQGRRMANGQGRGMGKNQGRGHGQGMANNQGRGLGHGVQNGQGLGMRNCQGRGQGVVNVQDQQD